MLEAARPPGREAREGFRMAAPVSTPTRIPQYKAVPSALLNVCFVLFVINASFFPAGFFAHWWIIDDKGLGIPTDFANVWPAGKLGLDGCPSLGYDSDIQKQVQAPGPAKGRT